MSSTSHFITFYDLRSTLSRPGWSPNTWRTRFILNYKNLPYQTQWVPIQNIEPVLRAADVPPTRTEKPLYTVPAIVDQRPDGSSHALSDSALIAEFLEETYPSPPIFPGDTKAVQEEIIKAIMQHVAMNMGFMVISTTARILHPEDAAYFIPSRKEIFGVNVEDMYPEDSEKREAVWQKLQEGFNTLLEIFAAKGGSGKVWIFGESPTYADFVLVSYFIWMEKAGPEGAWDRVKTLNGGRWNAMYQGAEKYMKVV